MSNLWINWGFMWWRLQIGPDRAWVRLCRNYGWVRGLWWRWFIKPYVLPFFDPATCGDFSEIVTVERVRGVLFVTTKRQAYAIADYMDTIDLQVHVLGHVR